MNRPGVAAEAECLCRQGRTGIAIVATMISDRSFFRSFCRYFIVGAPESQNSRVMVSILFPLFHGLCALGVKRISARPSRLSVHIVPRDGGRSQKERVEVKMSDGQTLRRQKIEDRYQITDGQCGEYFS